MRGIRVKNKKISLHDIYRRLVEDTGDTSWVIDRILSFMNEFYVFKNREGRMCIYYVKENRLDKCF
jgi:hypothetical protein